MSDLLAELTAPGDNRRNSHIHAILESVTPEEREAIVGALNSDVGMTVLSQRLRARGWDISPDHVRRWRTR